MASLHVTVVVIGGGGHGVGNLTVVEGCVFLENEASRHGSAVAIGTYLWYQRFGITVVRNK